MVFIAHAKGYFAHAGLNVTLQPYTTGKDALDAALEGRTELATVADIPIMFAVMKGHPMSIVATIFTEEKDPGVIGRKDKGILTPADLNGKRIGVTLGTSAHFMLDALLIRQKLSTDDVTLHDLQPQELVEALLQGDVDAVATWGPYLGALRTQLGANGTIFDSEGIYVTLDQSLLLSLEDETRWAIKNELTDRTNIPNYLDHFYLDALEAVMPAAVTVIH